MIRNRIVAVCLVVALALGFCACDEFVTTLSTGNTDVVLPLVEIDIGLVLPLTGGASAYGFSMQRGFHLARNEINFSLENPVWITFITEDDMSTVDGIANAYQHLVEPVCRLLSGPPSRRRQSKLSRLHKRMGSWLSVPCPRQPA